MLSFTGLLCIFCNSVLKIDTKRQTSVCVFTTNGSFYTQHAVKICPLQKCRAHYHYSYYTKLNVYYKDKKLAKYFYDNSLDNEYFFATSSTAFATSFLRSFYTQMFLCPEFSFYQKAMSFNLDMPTGNIILAPKRLRDAFFQFSLLEMWKFFKKNDQLSSLSQSHDIDTNVNDLTPFLKEAFRCL